MDLEALAFTGERAVEGETPARVWQDHRARYDFSAPFAVGRSVLDAACGSGYGSRLLVDAGARAVVGVDLDADAVRFAQTRYGAPRLAYVTASVAGIPFAARSFDVITCFETIEHVDDARAALRELARVLVNDGILLVSTPNRRVTSPGKAMADAPDNRWHKVEFNEPEFDALLADHYRVLARYGQRMVGRFWYCAGVRSWARALLPFAYARDRGASLPAPLQPGTEARYLLYVCQKQRDR